MVRMYIYVVCCIDQATSQASYTVRKIMLVADRLVLTDPRSVRLTPRRRSNSTTTHFDRRFGTYSACLVLLAYVWCVCCTFYVSAAERPSDFYVRSRSDICSALAPAARVHVRYVHVALLCITCCMSTASHMPTSSSLDHTHTVVVPSIERGVSMPSRHVASAPYAPGRLSEELRGFSLASTWNLNIF